MTNFSSTKKKKELITPESSLLFVPIIIGLLILTSLLAFIYRPLTQKLRNEESQIEVLREKISLIPIYKKYIKEVSINTTKAQKQQERLIDIISDPQQLNTILTEINKICIDNEIEIINVLPRPVVKYPQPKDKDPFLISSIEKHTYKLTLKGEFNRLLDFLKEIELLQPIAISNEIEIKSIPNNLKTERLDLLMSFNLTTYARVLDSKDKLKTNTIN